MTPNPADEIKRLEDCFGDLARVVALPAVWSGYGVSQVLTTLLDALFAMLRLELVYARLDDPVDERPLEILRSRLPEGVAPSSREVGTALADCWRRGVLAAVARVPNPVGDGEVSIVPLRLGLEGDPAGVLVVGARRDNFPTANEMLLLRVATSQAGIGLREARLPDEHRRPLQRLEDERTALAALVERSTDFIAMTTAEGRVFFVNPAGRRLAGIDSDEEMRATRLLDYVIGADRERFEAVVLPTVFREGRWQGEMRFRNLRTGAATPMLQEVFTIRDRSRDRTLAIAMINRDVTELVRSRESTSESERRFRLVAEAIPHQLWTSLPDGTVDYCNRRWADYSGLTVETAQGFGWTAAVHPDDVPAVRRAWEDARARLVPYEIEKRLRGPDGRYRRFLSRAVPVCDEHGRLLQWIGTYTDIEDSRQAEDALRDARAKLADVSRLTMMGELGATLAHELTQPLTAAVTNGTACLQWLDRDQPDVAEAMSAARRIIRDTNRAGDVIGHTRALLKTSPGESTRLDISVVIREVITLIQLELTRHRISFHAALADYLPTVLGDRIQLQQVILNLSMNGIEAMADIDEGCRDLTIRSGPHHANDGPGVLVAVQDTGRGVTPETRDRLFDAFYTTKAHGLGMGLSISRNIIERHGGRLWATANPGPGATFQFVLPASSP